MDTSQSNGGFFDDANDALDLDLFRRYSEELFIVTSTNLSIRHVSSSVERILGFTVDELMGQQWGEHFHSQDVDNMQRVLKALTRGRDGMFEARHLQGNGFYIWVSVFASVDKTQSELQWVFRVRDVSQRKIAQKQLEVTLNELRAFKRVLDVHALVSIVDVDFKITYVNEKFTEVSHFDLTELIGHSHSMLKSGVNDAQLYKDLHETLLAGDIWKGEICNRNKQGELYWVDATIVPFFDRHGEPYQYMAIGYEVTSHKQAQEALETHRESLYKAKAAAESASLAKSQFLASMSHELRTPLNGILGYSQILQKQRGLPESVISAIEVIERSGRHLLDLINELLDISRIEAGEMKLEPRVFNLKQCIQSVEDMFLARATQKKLKFSVELTNKLPSLVKADELRLRQVLINLLGNAVKFTEQGSVKLLVRAEADGVHFIAEDTGPGIPEGMHDVIFEPFKQLETSGKHAGSGLGLAISKQLVELMGGAVTLESEVGRGTQVKVFIPLVELDVSESSESSASAPVMGYAGERKRLLVVDDFADNRQLYCDMLKPMGFEIVEAINGVDCLEKLESVQPDMILMDIRMPHMDGLEATRRIRSDKRFSNCCIIAVSAGAYEQDIAESMQAGCDLFLSKPVNFKELAGAISKLLGLEVVKSSSSSFAGEASAKVEEILEPSEAIVKAMHNYLCVGDIIGIRRYLRDALNHATGNDVNFLKAASKHAQRFDLKELRLLLKPFLKANDE